MNELCFHSYFSATDDVEDLLWLVGVYRSSFVRWREPATVLGSGDTAVTRAKPLPF